MEEKKNELSIHFSNIEIETFAFDGIVRRKNEKNHIVSFEAYPAASNKHKNIIAKSALHSITYYSGIILDKKGQRRQLIGYLKGELGYQINNSGILNGRKEPKTIFEIEQITKDVIELILPEFRWLTKQQLPEVLKLGFLGRLGGYNNFTLSNLNTWLTNYHTSIVDVLIEQRTFESAKAQEPKKELTAEEQEERKEKLLISQIEMLKSILNNPYLVKGLEESNEGNELKTVFGESLSKYLYQRGYNLNLAFDYLLSKGLVNPKENEIQQLMEKQVLKVSAVFKLNPPEEIANKYKSIYAKNDFMNSLILKLIEEKENLKFIERIENE